MVVPLNGKFITVFLAHKKRCRICWSDTESLPLCCYTLKQLKSGRYRHIDTNMGIIVRNQTCYKPYYKYDKSNIAQPN